MFCMFYHQIPLSLMFAMKYIHECIDLLSTCVSLDRHAAPVLPKLAVFVFLHFKQIVQVYSI